MADAMVDSGAKCNLLSHTTWKTLGQPTLRPSKLSLIDFKGERSQAIGEILLRVRVQDQAMIVPFQVLPTNGCNWQLLLGRTWMQQTNFQMNWDTREYKLKVSKSVLTGTSAERLDLPSTSVEEKSLTVQTQTQQQQAQLAEATTWIKDKAHPNFGWKVATSLLKAQGYGRRWKDC